MLNDNFPTTIFLLSGVSARQLTGSSPVRNLKIIWLTASASVWNLQNNTDKGF